jgi:DNA-binding beta-propeller fold protein YncE
MLVAKCGRLIAGLVGAALLGGAAPSKPNLPKLSVQVEKEADSGNLLTVDLSGVTGSTTIGTPSTPRIWIEEAFAGTTDAGKPSCEARVSRLSQTSGLQAPVRDFNVMHVATLTGKGIHVLDPRGGLRGARSLAFVDLGSRPGEWLWSEASGRIWVTLPATNEVVAVDAGSWKVARRYPGLDQPIAMVEGAGAKGAPVTLAVLTQSQGRYAVHMISTTGVRKEGLPGSATRLDDLGGGRFAAHGGDSFYIVGGGTVSTRAGGLTQSRYVASANALFGLLADGSPAVDDGKSPIRKLTNAGDVKVTNLWLSPDQKLLLAYSPDGSLVHVIDVASRSIVRALPIERPRTIDASRSFLFIRTASRGETLVIPRTGLLENRSAPPRWIAGGELPGATRDRLPLVATPDGLAAWIDPERNQIYVYHEGMNIPSSTLRLPDSDTSDLKLVGPLVRAVDNGRFSAAATLQNGGDYVAVAQGMDPRFTLCTAFKLEGRAVEQAEASRYFIKLLSASTQLRAGDMAKVSFGVTAGGKPLEATVTPSFGVVMMDMAGQYQERFRADRQNDGTYLATFTAKREGIFMVLPDPATFPGRVMGRPVATFEVKEP